MTENMKHIDVTAEQALLLAEVVHSLRPAKEGE
jgi:hypothetical protein